MHSLQGSGLRRTLCPHQMVLSSSWGGTTPRLSRKHRLVRSHKEAQGPQSLEKTGLARLGPSRAWRHEAGPPEEWAKGQGAQVV